MDQVSLRSLNHDNGLKSMGLEPRLRWKTTQKEFQYVPSPKQRALVIDLSGGLGWSPECEKTVSLLWKEESDQEPLGHQLLREARGLASHNPRSSFLICYSALEVGVKQHIERCKPIAGWLAIYSPTPPLKKMLRDYFPQIHEDNLDFQNWTELSRHFNRIQDFGDERNALAHRGEDNYGSLAGYLDLTKDFLYAFDGLEGRLWAKKLISKEFADLLGWR